MSTTEHESDLHLNSLVSILVHSWIVVFLVLIAVIGCEKSTPQRTVVLYTSIDQPVAAPIVREFEKQTGIRVTLVTDTEATKSVGLAEKLRAEKSNPQADVWWSNEPFHTINLAEEGVLAAYDSPASADVPAKFRDPQHRWASNAFRVRVIAGRVGEHANIQPGSLDELTEPYLKDAVGMARPMAGTTGGHVAALYILWGDDKADRYFGALRANGVKLLGGNSVVAEMVAKGALTAGLTDNDDVVAAAEIGGIQSAPPDQDAFGTLLIPTTVGLVQGAAHSTEARRLIDYLSSKEVEEKLIDVKFAYGSIRSANVKAMDVDYVAVAKKLPEAVRRATAILEGRK
jgi:iron(III) transport system substrate-binding protein